MGIVLPFLAPWIQARGFGSLAIGVLMALPPLFTMLAPWSWGRWADRSGQRKPLLVLALAVASLSLGAMVVAPGLGPVVGLMALYAFARAPILPYIEATTLEQAERGRFAYGSIRLWGSLAFMATSFGYGGLREHLGPDAGILAAAVLLAVGAWIALALPGPADREPRPAVPVGARRASGDVRFFACCALMQASHGAYYTFYSIHLQDAAYRGAAIGGLWALAIVCEVVLLTRVDAILHRWGRPAVLRACLAVATLRWLLIGSSTSAGWLVLAQTLHAATYAAFHVAAIRTVYERFGGTHRARGQALYSGMTFGLGLFVGNLTAGGLADAVGLPVLFLGSAVLPLAALLVLGALPRGRPERAA